ncbi:Mobile element protein [Grimontia indica]|uniref:Mobile element protein n=1 Tax=Grimontia indica TaxID=1056512 RepID=R1GZV9_9GAMM|nr:Mobile element protein [Grimontia indica]
MVLAASEFKCTKELKAENAKLKKMFADVSLENHAMKELCAKKGW